MQVVHNLTNWTFRVVKKIVQSEFFATQSSNLNTQIGKETTRSKGQYINNK